MRSFRTSVVVAAALAALCWSGISNADDDMGKTHHEGEQGMPSSSTSEAGSSTNDPNVPSGTTTTTTGTGTSTSTGTTPTPSTGTSGTGAYDTQLGAQPGYGGSQALPQTTYPVTTTTTAADYNEMVGAEKSGYDFRPNRPLLITGAAVFAGTYGASAIVAASNDNSSDDYLFVPVAGPWMDLADRPCSIGDSAPGCGSTEDWNQALIIGSGVLQGLGVGLAVASLIVPERRGERAAKATPHERSVAASKPTVRLTPVNYRNGGGIGALGSF